MSTKWDNDEVIQRLREYLKIPSVHPDIDYDDCVKFLKKQAEELGLPVTVYELVPKKPVVVITWEGLEPKEPSILLNSHMDVVPVYEEHWTYPPFDATISEDGFIYARGTQDMKSIGMMHLEAIRRLKNAGVKLKRTVHVSFVPDEEIGGVDGMCTFASSEEFKKLNIGFELDESGPSPNPDEVVIFYGERTSRQITITCQGVTGHGALVVAGAGQTAGEKLHYIIDKFMTLRAYEQNKVAQGAWFGDVTTINLTQVQLEGRRVLKGFCINVGMRDVCRDVTTPSPTNGGVQINVLPKSLSVSFDIRIACDVDHDEFENMISRWCKEAGENVTFKYVVKNPEVKCTQLNDELIFWKAMRQAVNDMGVKIKVVICPGATDARYVRQQNIPAINFSPIINAPLLIHCHDETIHVDTYKKGIDIMEKVVAAVAIV